MTSTPIARNAWTPSYGDNAAENYQKYFVPVIGGPFALDLVNEAGLRPGEHVLDVACGTGTIARLAAERVGINGRVSALDVNAAMLSVARSQPSANPIKWYETAAESVPLPDHSFDVIFCGLSFQFFADKSAALREMHRLLKPGGRVYISTPVPNGFFDLFDRAIARHVSEEASAFVHAVFSLNDPREMEVLLTGAGFSSVTVSSHSRSVQLPPAREFMWQYIYCTPLMALLPQSGNAQTEALERDVVAAWEPWASGDGLQYDQANLVSSARRAA
jgi:ubiquinone/menaquinone biosynthesis C-methylase UbiE